LAALAHPTRLQIFRALVVVGHAGMNPGPMGAALSLPPATLSFHLKELANAGLVTHERNGRHLVYRAAFARMNSVLSYLTANCCQGEACLETPATLCDC
jgi:DNA-binding transcriptional ArsR family regulator